MNRLRADAITWRIQWNNCENLSQGSTWRWQIRISETFGSHFSLIYFPLSGLIATSGHYLHRFLIRLLNSQLSISESSHYFDWIKILRVFYLFIYLFIYHFVVDMANIPEGKMAADVNAGRQVALNCPLNPNESTSFESPIRHFKSLFRLCFVVFFVFFCCCYFFFLAARYANNGDRLLFLHQTPSPSSFCSLFLSLLGHFCLNNGEGNAEMQLRFIAIPADPFRNDRPDHYPVQFRFESMIHLSPSSISFDS